MTTARRASKPAASRPVFCELCRRPHPVTRADAVDDRGLPVPDADAALVAHYRLATLARTAAPFAVTSLPGVARATAKADARRRALVAVAQ